MQRKAIRVRPVIRVRAGDPRSAGNPCSAWGLRLARQNSFGQESDFRPKPNSAGGAQRQSGVEGSPPGPVRQGALRCYEPPSPPALRQPAQLGEHARRAVISMQRSFQTSRTAASLNGTIQPSQQPSSMGLLAARQVSGPQHGISSRFPYGSYRDRADVGMYAAITYT